MIERALRCRGRPTSPPAWRVLKWEFRRIAGLLCHPLRTLFVVATAAFLASGPWPSALANGGWSTPINLSHSPNGSWFPDLAVSGTGQIGVVWCETEWDEFQVGSERLMISSWNGRRWSSPNDLVPSSPTIKRHAIAADGGETLYLTFLEDTPPRYWRGIYFGHAPIAKAHSAAAWSDWRFLGGREGGYVSDMVVDREGRLHVIYTAYTEQPPSRLCPEGLCSDIFYRRSVDGGRTWSSPFNLSRSEPGSKRIGLMLDGGGNLHAFWEEGGDRYRADAHIGVAHAMSRDGGVSWSKPTLFTFAGGVPHQPVVGYDGRGQTIIVWRTVNAEDDVADRVYYQVSADGLSWSPPQVIPGVWARAAEAQFDTYAMATDSSGTLHLVGVLRRSPREGQPGLFHLEWDGEQWSSPELIMVGNGYPEYPRLAIEDGNVLHVVWAVREFPEYTPQRVDVWYSAKRLAAPRWTPTPRSTSVPTLPAPQSPTVIPSPTPYPTLADAGHGLPKDIYTESDEVVKLLIALSPVILLILVALAIRYVWPRTPQR